MSPTSIFAPLSTPAESIFELSVLVLAIAAAIFAVVAALLVYSVVKFRKRRNDDGREPAQVYGSLQVELAWTITPVIIVLVLFLASARVVFAVQDAPRTKDSLEVTVVGHQFWWEYRYPGLKVVTHHLGGGMIPFFDGRIGAAMLSIQSVKGCGIGDGFDLAGRPGSEAHDEIFHSPERGYYRETNRAGGLEGGMTTGEPLVVRGFMKPLPTLTKPLRSVDIATHEPAEALRERTDSCTVPAAGVVGEAMVAFVLADAYRAKFGGDHIDDVRQALACYRERIGWQR